MVWILKHCQFEYIATYSLCTLPGSEPDLQVGYERPKIKCSGVGAASKKLTVIDLSISAESLLSTAFLITAFDRQIVVFFPAACMWDL